MGFWSLTRGQQHRQLTSIRPSLHLQVNGINDASQGTLSSWLICMMVIFHLQTCTPAVLPAFKALHSDWSTAEGQTGLRPLDSAARATPLALHHALGRAHALAMSMREFGRGQEAGIAQLLGLFFVKVNAAINW